MAFAKIDVNLPDDIAIREAGAAAEHLYLRAIFHCRKLLTDGVIHRVFLNEIARGIKGKPQELASILVRVGLWTETESGWSIPFDKWEKWQETKAQVEEAQEKARNRVRRFRAKQKTNADETPEKRDCNGVTSACVTGNAGAHTDTDTDTEADTEHLSSRFTPPTLSEVQAYCLERANGIDPAAFIAHYEATGWRRGQGTGLKIKDWRACVRTWESKRNGEVRPGKKTPRVYDPKTDGPYNPYAED